MWWSPGLSPAHINMWHWLWDRENCLGLLLPSCQNTFCSFLLCFTRAPIWSFTNFSLPYYHRVQILSPCLALVGQRWTARQKEIYLYGVWCGTVSAVEISVNLSVGAGSVCLLPELFKQRICHISSDRGREANKHTESIRVWMQRRQRCLPWSQVVYFVWWSHRFELNNTYEATGQLPKNTQPQEAGGGVESKCKQDQAHARHTLEWL